MTLRARGIWMLASLRLTLGLMASLLVLLVAARLTGWPLLTRLFAVPFILLFANLMAALMRHQRLRRQRGLLAFHVGLAGLALLVAIGRLMTFQGHVAVTVGTPFDPANVVAEAPTLLHGFHLAEAAFLQGPFSIAYDQGLNRRETRSTVRIRRDDGGWREIVVGDDHPLVVDGYRLYTTANKGFAPIFTWIAADGTEQTGAFHLPSYPANADRQGGEWISADGSLRLVIWLDMSRPVMEEGAAWTFHLPDDARLVVIDGARRETLAPGQSIGFGKGRLRYDRLSSWMGYTIFYDPTLPWLFATAMVAAAGLVWHALSRLRLGATSPWRGKTCEEAAYAQQGGSR